MNLGVQTMEGGLPRAIAAQKVSVWAQAWLPALHTVLFYELEKVPLFHWVGWVGFCTCSALSWVRQAPGPRRLQCLEGPCNESSSSEMFRAISSLSVSEWEPEFPKAKAS